MLLLAPLLFDSSLWGDEVAEEPPPISEPAVVSDHPNTCRGKTANNGSDKYEPLPDAYWELRKQYLKLQADLHSQSS